MPNDEAKKKWRVRTWDVSDLQRPGGDGEAERFENALNKLADEKYEIYEVSFDKRMIVGRLEEEDDEMPQLIASGPPPMPLGFAAVLQDIFSRRRPSQPPAPEATEPAEAATTEEAEAQSASTPDEVPSPGDIFIPEGKFTNQFFGCLNNVISAKMQGDPYTEKRVASLVTQMFKGVPLDEIQKSLADTERFHNQHQAMREKEGLDCGEDCVLHAVFTITEEKLKAHLAANPAN